MSLEDKLAQKLSRWQYHGAKREAEPLVGLNGFVLLLCFRMRFMAVVFLVMMIGSMAGVFALGIAGFQPLTIKRGFFAVSSIVMVIVALYLVIDRFMYRVELNRDGITLHRILFAPATIKWSDVRAFIYEPGDDEIRIVSSDGRTMMLSLGLNGLSELRQCLSTLVPREQLIDSWNRVDPLLTEDFSVWS